MKFSAPTPYHQRALRLSAMSVALAALAACGGSGGGTSDFASAKTKLVGTVTDATTNAAVGNATINVGTTGKTSTTSSTNQAGAYDFAIDTGTLNTSVDIYAAVYKEGYRTCTVKLQNLPTQGSTTNLGTCSSLTPLVAGEFYPQAGATLTRLGDGVADGDANSQLQLPKEQSKGTSTVVEIGGLDGINANLDISKYTTFTVNVDFRGLQVGGCEDSAVIYQGTPGANAVTFSKATTPPMNPSDAAGAMSTQSFSIPLATSGFTATGGKFYLQLNSGPCKTDQADDFEFMNVNAKFHN